jgi:hypothetical protein
LVRIDIKVLRLAEAQQRLLAATQNDTAMVLDIFRTSSLKIPLEDQLPDLGVRAASRSHVPGSPRRAAPPPHQRRAQPAQAAASSTRKSGWGGPRSAAPDQPRSPAPAPTPSDLCLERRVDLPSRPFRHFPLRLLQLNDPESN